jgi:phage-related tail fiber protein
MPATRHLIETDIQDNVQSSTTLWSSEKTKAYVDTVAQGLNPKQSVRAATTENITLSGEQTIDGVALVENDRVLVKNQTAAEQNGIYTVHTGAWARAGDADTSEKIRAAFCFVEEGDANANKMFNLVTDNITLGTTALVFSQFGALVDLGAYTDDIEITDSAKGVILRSPDDTRWRITVGDDGALTATSL